MPWCPNCKTEYREGITVCADCKTELVAEYRDVLLKNATAMLVQVDAEHQVFVQKLHDFLEYSDISSVVLPEGDMIGVYVAPEDFNKAKKCFKAFYSVETEISTQRAQEAAFLKGEDYFGDDEDEEEETEDASEAMDDTSAYRQISRQQSRENGEVKYVSAIAKYDDYRSSGFTFTILGALGIGFALLNFIGVFSLFGSVFSSTVLFVMFAIFLGLGLFSFAKAGSYKEAAAQEKQLTEEVKEWMQTNFTEELLDSLNKEEDVVDGKRTAELLYLDRLDQLLGMVHTAFPNLPDSLAEQLIEEFCNQNED